GPRERPGHEQARGHRLPGFFAEVESAAHSGGGVVCIFAAGGFLVGAFAAEHHLLRMPIVDVIVFRDVVINTNDVFDVGVVVLREPAVVHCRGHGASLVVAMHDL